jgi:alkylhydroperoxidase/carboxymuconolactone decarboxylase family protein YurZ
MFSSAVVSEAQTVNTQALSPNQRSIVTISAFTANGNLEELKTPLNEGLDAGLTVSEIKEFLVQMYAYCGFPCSLNAINTFMVVMDERQ